MQTSTKAEGETEGTYGQEGDLPLPEDEISRIRVLLRPPSIPGLKNWGIPDETDKAPDPSLTQKLKTFHTLKRDPSNPKHFNDSLMSNRSFRNPHLYAKLVEFVDVDERTSNFKIHTGRGEAEGFKEEWYADKLAELQKVRSEQTASSSSSGKRAQIDFTSSSSSSTATAAIATTTLGLGAAAVSSSGSKHRFHPYAAAAGASAGLGMGIGAGAGASLYEKGIHAKGKEKEREREQEKDRHRERERTRWG
ncbi:hypothetical protein BDN72DRAFT_769422 [Pluteus cervinus]|uniref:Uncharacterized protein n=1 Tax=Pluteus cervinus TaxID=181527 RepID=A0ACD3ASN7_9AGAR|nr:hypothetical protein BDN72DRAFT_769422 [Pluteus cervinus]